MYELERLPAVQDYVVRALSVQEMDDDGAPKVCVGAP